MSSLDTPNLERRKTIATELEEMGVAVNRVTDYVDTDDELDERSRAESEVSFETINNKVHSDIRLIRGFMNSIKSTEINLQGKKPIASIYLNVIDNDIAIVDEHYKLYNSCSECNHLINQLKNLRKELINKMKGIIGGRLKRRHTMKKRRNKRRRTSRKY